MQEQCKNFKYKIINNKVKIEGCINQEEILSLPNKIENKEVVEIADYAFCEWRKLKQIYLPETLTNIGGHAFYNCRNLERISILGNIENLGDGAFKNCGKIKEILIETNTKERIGLKRILSELSQEICVIIKYKDEKKIANLVFPNYDYEFIPNVPARVFSEEIYGSGFSYRLCVKYNDIDYIQYDSLFSLAKRENSQETILKIILARLMYPYHLNSQNKRKYIEYLNENFISIMNIFLKQEELDKIKFMTEIGLITKDNIDDLLTLTNYNGSIAATGFLLEYQNNYLRKEKKRFDL